jgi:hypothetical protein
MPSNIMCLLFKDIAFTIKELNDAFSFFILDDS